MLSVCKTDNGIHEKYIENLLESTKHHNYATQKITDLSNLPLFDSEYLKSILLHPTIKNESNAELLEKKKLRIGFLKHLYIAFTKS